MYHHHHHTHTHARACPLTRNHPQQDELISHPSVLSYLAQMQDTGTDPVDEPSIIQGSHDDDAGEIDLS